MIKNWNQFIFESFDDKRWVSKEDIMDYLTFLSDDDIIYQVDECYYDKNSHKSSLIVLDTDSDILKVGDEISLGFMIRIGSSRGSDDLTTDFRTFINIMKSEGFLIWIEDDEGHISLESIYIYKGSLITWIPEKPGKPFTPNRDDWSDGDIYISNSEIFLYLKQDVIEIENDLQLAKFYNWQDFKESGGDIYFEMDIEDLSTIMLNRNSTWPQTLLNGLDCSDYESHYYQPDINSLFQYHLGKDDEVLMVKCVIKEFGGVKDFLDEIDDDIDPNASEDDVIKHVLSGGFYGKTEKVFKNSEIVGDIRSLIADWESQAHCDRNEEEMYKGFDRILDREEIKYEKEWKESKRFYYTAIKDSDGKVTGKKRVNYDDNGWIYKIFYQQRWISDYEKVRNGESLRYVFSEWAYDCYFDYSLDNYTHFSDYGDVNTAEMNKEIKSVLENYLNK
jgi:hypothetical protein